ncbi:MAG: nucleotidyltransferase family protein [Chloroflexota bacterium]
MTINTIDDLYTQREQILELADKHGATNIRIFGSFARGDANDNSDIDFLVTWDYQHVSAWGGVGFDLELETLLGRSVDVISDKSLNPYLKDDILAGATLL